MDTIFLSVIDINKPSFGLLYPTNKKYITLRETERQFILI